MLALPEVRERYVKGGFEPVGNKPEEFAQQIKADLAPLEQSGQGRQHSDRVNARKAAGEC